jgi:hypothetical protein
MRLGASRAWVPPRRHLSSAGLRSRRARLPRARPRPDPPHLGSCGCPGAGPGLALRASRARPRIGLGFLALPGAGDTCHNRLFGTGTRQCDLRACGLPGRVGGGSLVVAHFAAESWSGRLFGSRGAARAAARGRRPRDRHREGPVVTGSIGRAVPRNDLPRPRGRRSQRHAHLLLRCSTRCPWHVAVRRPQPVVLPAIHLLRSRSAGKPRERPACPRYRRSASNRA